MFRFFFTFATEQASKIQSPAPSFPWKAIKLHTMKYIPHPTPDNTTFRVILCGGEGFASWEFLVEWTDRWLMSKVGAGTPIEIVYRAPTGTRAPINKLAHRYAIERGYIATVATAYPAEHGDAAARMQYLAMLDYSHALILFWDNKDRECRDMLKLARKKGLLIREGWYNHKFKSNLVDA